MAAPMSNRRNAQGVALHDSPADDVGHTEALRSRYAASLKQEFLPCSVASLFLGVVLA